MFARKIIIILKNKRNKIWKKFKKEKRKRRRKREEERVLNKSLLHREFIRAEEINLGI